MTSRGDAGAHGAHRDIGVMPWSIGVTLAFATTRGQMGRMRVVTLACSNTEIVCALGCEGLLVGVDDHSDHPPDVIARLPRVGPDLGVDPEKVRALAPDLVIASLTVPGHEKVVASLEAAGLPLLVIEPHALDDVLESVRVIADALGVPERGKALASELEAGLAPKPALPGPRPRIMVEWWPRPVIVPGRLSWVNDLLERAGAENPLGREDVDSRPMTDEEAASLAPDAVVVSWCGVPFRKYRPDVVAKRKAFADTRAVREGRIFCISEAHLGRPGPRLVAGLSALREVVEACAPATRSPEIKP